MRVLITGAGGFIGSQLYTRFLKAGNIIEAWDLNADTQGKVIIKVVDLGDEAALVEKLSAFKPDCVIHCAGIADVNKSVQFPEMDYYGNVTLTHNLLFALHKAHLEKVRFVLLSSAAVYGNPSSLPIVESAALQPMSPYAIHKVMCEELCKYFKLNYGMNIKIARIFSAYGKGLKKQIFWDMYCKYQKSGKLNMFGTGDESRDYIHVNDVVDSLYRIATMKSEHIVFNVANGEEVTIRKATSTFARCAGISEDKISFNGEIKEGNPLNWRADIHRIQQLGYKKTIDIYDGLKDYYQWVNAK